MKSLVTLALALSCCSFATGKSSVVVVAETKPSSRNAKITVLQDGKAQANVKLIANLPQGQGIRSSVTDPRGIATLRHLPLGTSCITATGDGNLRGDLCLDVSEKSSRKTSLFNINLFQAPPAPPSLEDTLKAGEKTSPVERVRELEGLVVDPIGAVIANAEITIYKHGSHPQNPFTKLETNKEGQFAASLCAGTYTLVIQRPGFKTDLFVVEISPAGGEGKIQRTLQIGTIY